MDDITKSEIHIEVALYKKLIDVFQVGDYYSLVYNAKETRIEFCSEGIARILGHPPSGFDLEQLFQAIHPEDLHHVLNIEVTIAGFFNGLLPEKRLRYKARYDYRIRNACGVYVRILHQTVVMQCEADGRILRTFTIHTDVTHLKCDTTMSLSFIGLEGEPSLLDVDIVNLWQPAKKEAFTDREKAILRLIAKNKKSQEIADLLSISKNTVLRHRNNMHRKTGAHSGLELVSIALRQGWLTLEG